jgi:hypothetical protein
MKKTLLCVSVMMAGSAFATPFTGNSAASNAMGNTGVASAPAQDAFQFNPALLADYDDSVGFSLTLPSVKVFIDDSEGLIENGRDFVSGDAWADFQNIDADAFNTAISGDGATVLSMADVLANITTDINSISTAITAITTATDAGNAPSDAQTTALTDASNSLSTNALSLDTKTGVADTQATTLTTAVTGALDGLLGFNDSPLQLGLGIDVLNVALPSQTLGMALSISTTTTVGVNIGISDTDFEPVEGMAADLTGITSTAKALTVSINALAAANLALTTHLVTQPDPDTYSQDLSGAALFEDDVIAWGTTLASLATGVTSAQTDVDTKLTALTGFEGTNIKNGEVTPPTVGELTSDIEIVGANVSELGVSLAKRFVIGGQELSIGITPKLQSINIFEKTIGLATASDEISDASNDPAGYFLASTTQLFRANIDLGVAKTWDFHGKVRAGVALKDIIPWTLESQAGTELLIRPKLRIGGAHQTKFTLLAVDLDITENKPLKYGVPTRYLGIGAELNAWRHLSLRAGYRTNLSIDDSGVLSGGIGITPFGIGVQASVWAKPKPLEDWAEIIQDAGVVVQTSINF